jgi:hypothetical protein
MNIKELLIERVVNAFDDLKKQQYADQVWDIMQRSYKNVPGGFGTASSIEELIAKSGMWKMIVRDGVVTAANVYKDTAGRKSVASGTNGTPQGKQDWALIKSEDIKLGRAWGEVSGAAESIMKKMGAKPLSNKFAAALTGKEILELNPDGFHYTRLIQGEPHEKIIYGTINLTPELSKTLAAQGIELHTLPDNFQK